MHKNVDKYDTWENINLAGKAQKRLVHIMCDIKPSPKSYPKEYEIWESEMKEIRKWIISTHYRAIDKSIADLSIWRQCQI